MSDQLSAAAGAMGVPEAIAERSARARATATGQSYEDILAAWAGGEAVTAAAAPEPTPEDTTPDPGLAPETTPAADALPAQAPAAAMPAAASVALGAPAATGPPPILDAPAERPLTWVVGGIGVLMMALLIGFVFPSLPEAGNEVRSSHFALSDAGRDGQVVYLRAGCASCHTQVVRSVVADVGIGPVALPDSNQVLGFRRIGPDLSNAGGRLGADQLATLLAGHSNPAIALSETALNDLVTYLTETASPISGGE